MLDKIQQQLALLANPADGQFLQKYFKTSPGQYGEGDRFRGIRVPVLRRVAKEHQAITRETVLLLLHSAWHEDRLLALLILVRQYGKADAVGQTGIYELYLSQTQYINNWDLVDASAEHIVGAYLRERSRAPLHELAGSSWLWERRIAIMSTFHFIKHGEFAETLSVAEQLLRDPHDLIHKAVGWMLREIGKRDLSAAEAFLDRHARQMPRTMLRYAIERFPEARRQHYLHAR